MKRMVAVGLVVSIAVVPATAQSNDGTTTGKRIGNAIAGLVETAFPPIKTVIDAIWPNRTGRKTPEEAKTALEPKKEQAVTGQKANFDALSQAADDLDLARAFLTHCTVADRGVIKMQQLLRGKVSFNQDDKSRLSAEWNVARARIEKLGDPALDKRIDKLSDSYLKSVFQAIKDANLGALKNIDEQISKVDTGSAELLRSGLDDLEPKLGSVQTVANIVIGDIGGQLKDAVSKATVGMGSSASERSVTDVAANKKILGDAYPTLREK